MRAAGVTHYETFARELLDQIPDRPISFEVFADHPGEMRRQALLIASWAENVYVPIPDHYHGRGIGPGPGLRSFGRGVKVNVTATMTTGRVRRAADAPYMEARRLLFQCLPVGSPTPGHVRFR